MESRTYVRIHDGMVDHPKIVEVGGDAGWLNLCAISYCSRNLTDGVFPAAMVPRLSDRTRPAQLAKLLLDKGLWHTDQHDCDRCPQPGPGQYIVHDYLVHQRSRAEVEELSQKRRIAGSKGGKAKATAVASASPVAKQTASKSVAGGKQKRSSVSDREESEELRSSDASASPSEPSAQHLVAEWIDLGGGVQPDRRLKGQVSQEFKRLLDEGIPFEQVQSGMRIWHEKNLAIGALKSCVHGIRTGTNGRPPANGAAHRPSTTDVRVATGVALVEKFRAIDQQEATAQLALGGAQ